MMTTSTLAKLAGPAPRPEPERDQWGRYRIPHPETGKVTSWTRATTLAGTIANQYGLTKWKQRMTLYGVAHRADLYAEAASITDKDAAKNQLDKLVDAAMEAAGSSSRARLGTALHAFSEQVDAGADITIPAPYDADIAAYRATMSTAGVQIIPEMIERIVVNVELGVAGTFDRLVNIDGELFVADLKTGRDLSYSWHEIAAQLAIYAGADTIFDVATGQHTPMPDVNQDRGLVMELPVGEATCTLHWVDLRQGRHAVELCAAVREWRKVKDLAEPFTVTTTAAAAAVPAEPTATASTLEAMLNTPPAPANDPVHVGDVISETVEDLAAKRRVWITGRIMDLPADAKKSLARNWPAGIPTLKASDDHDNAQLSTIAELVSRVEAAFGLPFRDPDPAREPADIDALTDRISKLPKDLKQQLQDTIESDHHITLATIREGDLPAVEDTLIAIEQAHADRIKWVRIQISDVDVALVSAALNTLHLPGINSATRSQARLLTELLSSIDAGTIGLEFVPDDTSRLVVTDQAEKILVERHGSKKTLLAAMKQAAALHALHKPTSTAMGLDDPLLVAAVTNPNPF